MSNIFTKNLAELFGVDPEKISKKGLPKTITDKARAKRKKARKLAKMHRRINRQKNKR
jgi:hypothetical protein